LIIAFVAFLSFLIILFFVKPSNVNKYKVVNKKMVLSVYASGYIDSSDSVEIKSEVSGYIEKIFVKENDEVRKGQLLATILNKTIKNLWRRYLLSCLWCKAKGTQG